MAVNYGSKRTVVGAHYGLGDWLVQRFTAGLMAIFTIVPLIQVIFSWMGADRLRQVGRHLLVAVDESADLRRHRGADLARLGWHAQLPGWTTSNRSACT